jgi:hypothetical protein
MKPRQKEVLRVAVFAALIWSSLLAEKVNGGFMKEIKEFIKQVRKFNL